MNTCMIAHEKGLSNLDRMAYIIDKAFLQDSVAMVIKNKVECELLRIMPEPVADQVSFQACLAQVMHVRSTERTISMGRTFVSSVEGIESMFRDDLEV